MKTHACNFIYINKVATFTGHAKYSRLIAKILKIKILVQPIFIDFVRFIVNF